MARRWTKSEEEKFRKELFGLYVLQNKTISEIASILNLGSYQTVYDRLKRLGIETCRNKKSHANNMRSDIVLPSHSGDFAELLGILLGDGSITRYQIWVTLGTKELSYAKYVQVLIRRVFGGTPKVTIRKTGYTDVCLGSTMAAKFLFEEGLVRNKVLAQVDVPMWIFERDEYMKRFLRGFFDTDGSIYKLRHGTQISLTNYSLPLLTSLQKMLKILRYHPSAISSHKVYITRIPEIERFFCEITPANPKHKLRYRNYLGTYASIG